MRSKTSAVVREEPTFIEGARREQIVGCAIETLAELGFQRASLAEIAKRAGISKSVISYYFATKDDLIAQVVASVYESARAAMLPVIDGQPTATAMLRAYITTNIAFIRDYPHHIGALLEVSFNTRPGDSASNLSGRVRSATADIESVLRWGQETGEFRKFDVRTMATVIRAAIDAMPARMATVGRVDLDGYGETLAELFELGTTSGVKATKGRRR
jgi:AcrR family transcriptional regulator